MKKQTNFFKTDLRAIHLLAFFSDHDNDDRVDKTMHETRSSVKHTNGIDKSTTLIAVRGKNPISRTRMVIKNRI